MDAISSTHGSHGNPPALRECQSFVVNSALESEGFTLLEAQCSQDRLSGLQTITFSCSAVNFSNREVNVVQQTLDNTPAE